jgi:Bacterial SH3 domain
MGIIRLILITAALIWLAMFYFGRDDGLPSNRLGRTPTPAEIAVTPDAAPAPVPEAPAPDVAPQSADPVAAAVAEAIEAPDPAPVAEPAPEPAPAPAATPEPAPQPAAAPDPEPDLVLYVSGRVVNVRSGPSTTFAAITSLSRGAAVVDLGDAGEGWRQIRVETGETGYMSGDFLSPDPQ